MRELLGLVSRQVDQLRDRLTGEMHAVLTRSLRELGEETGRECRGELTPLGYFFSSPGFTDECAHLFLATEVVPRAEGCAHDEHESILEVGKFSPRQWSDLIAQGEIVDANTLAVFARLQARGIFS